MILLSAYEVIYIGESEMLGYELWLRRKLRPILT
jgi:hypothetical protein